MARDGASEQYVAGLALAHLRHDETGEQDRRAEVHLQRGIDVGDLHVGEVAKRRHDAGIVDQHVDGEIGKDRFQRLAVGDVDGNGDDAWTLGLQLFQRRLAAADRIDVVARVAQRDGDGSPYAARRTSDEGCRHLSFPDCLTVSVQALADAAKPRKAAKRKDKLSKGFPAVKHSTLPTRSPGAANQGKTMPSARGEGFSAVGGTKTRLSRSPGQAAFSARAKGSKSSPLIRPSAQAFSFW